MIEIVKRVSQRQMRIWAPLLSRLSILLAVFGPATITAMADNDAGGVATYSIAGATLGYPILFPLLIITVLLGDHAGNGHASHPGHAPRSGGPDP